MNIDTLNALAAAVTNGATAFNEALAAARAAGVRADVTLIFTGPPAPGRVQPQADLAVDVVLPLPLAQ